MFEHAIKPKLMMACNSPFLINSRTKDVVHLSTSCRTLPDLLEVGTSDLPAIFSWARHQLQLIALSGLLQRRRRNYNHLLGLICCSTALHSLNNA
jgi:hypothetical protein